MSDFILGREYVSHWVDCQKALPIVKGDERPSTEYQAWDWIKTPFPPASEDALFLSLRLSLDLPEQSFFTDRGFGSLSFLDQQALGPALDPEFFKRQAPEEEEQLPLLNSILNDLEEEEIHHLQTIVDELSRAEARDPKLAAVRYFLTQHRTEGKTWLEHGCIIFSQYYDTAYFIGAELAKLMPQEPIGVYAGTGKSGLFKGHEFVATERDKLKARVTDREIRLMVATDAACEGLNLQTLGTLINVDLPWNPARLEQRLGRIKRYGQACPTVDMLNLVYHDTQDAKVYQALSRRMKDRYDLFGGLPDTIEDDWIEDIENLEHRMDEYMHLRQQARDQFELRYETTLEPDQNRWELCAEVLSRQDVIEKLSEPW